jgi:hypothetical protein
MMLMMLSLWDDADDDDDDDDKHVWPTWAVGCGLWAPASGVFIFRHNTCYGIGTHINSLHVGFKCRVLGFRVFYRP